MMVAVKKGFDYQAAVRQGARLRVATKYVNTTREHFAAKGVHVDLIRLYGSMELAPLVGLADAIVDLVSTGGTLRANSLVAVEEIMPVSARLIVNQAALKTRRGELRAADRGFLAGGGEMKLRRLSTGAAGFDAALEGLTRYEAAQDAALQDTVRRIIADVRSRGDAAVREYTRRFDGADVVELKTTVSIGKADEEACARDQRIKAFRGSSCSIVGVLDADCTRLGQRVTPPSGRIVRAARRLPLGADERVRRRVAG